MGIKNLPGGGLGFRATTGAGSFKKEFSSAVRFGELKNLADNKVSILKVVKKYESAIRVHKFDRLRQRAAYREIKKLEGSNLNKQDIIDTKNVLKHFSERPTEEVKIDKARINKAENPNPLEKREAAGLMARHTDAPSGNRIGIHSLGSQGSGMQEQGMHGSGVHGVSGPTSDDLKPYEGDNRASRGKAARAELNYKHMQGLGNSQAAQNLQKKSFEDMNHLLAA